MLLLFAGNEDGVYKKRANTACEINLIVISWIGILWVARLFLGGVDGY